MKKIISLFLVAIFTCGIAGCGKANNASQSDASTDIYNEVIDAEEDDLVNSGAEGIINSNSSSGGISKKENSSNVTASKVYKADEAKSQSFLESVPKSLRGKTVRVLTWWEPLASEKAKIKNFEEKTGITIKWINSGDPENVFTKLASMKGTGNAPDIAPIMQKDFPSIVMQNYFQPLTNGSVDLNDQMYDKETMDQFKYNGNYYGAMIKSSSMVTFDVIIFNKDLYTRFGLENPNSLWQKGQWNWDTFLTSCQQLVKKGAKYGIVSDYGGNWLSATTGVDAVKYANGKLENNTKDANLIKGYQFVNDLKIKYKVMDGGTNYTFFKSQEAGMVLTGNYILQNGDWIDKNISFNWGVAPAPCPSGSQVYVPSEAKLFGFPVGAKNVDAASYWLRYWLDTTFDDVNTPWWSQKQEGITEFNSWLWDQKKTYSFHKGVITKGGDYDSNTLAVQASECGSENVKSTLDKWSGVIDSKINVINSEK